MVGDTQGPSCTVVVGRQAIVDRQRAVVGYELLFRTVDGLGPASSLLSGDAMTSEVLYGALNVGLDQIVAGGLVFCNADRGLLVGSKPLTLPPHQTVLEVLETVAIDAEVLAGCRRLRSEGFSLALDDFVWFEGAEALLELASFVKIDVLAVKGDDLVELVRRCREYPVRLIAEKIETPGELRRLERMGFDLFQGYVIERPTIVSGRELGSSDLGRVRLAAMVATSVLDLNEVEDLLRHEPGMTHQVLRLAAVGILGGTLNRVGNLRQALILLGETKIRSWIALLLAHAAGGGSEDDLLLAMTRARACELLAERIPTMAAPSAFAAGMISAFDVLLGVPASELETSLPLSDVLREGAFGHRSDIAELVRDVIDYQSGYLSGHRRSDLPRGAMDSAFAEAFRWALARSAQLSQAA
jgi:c-di-GMP-related signal transduction protein